MAHYILDFTSNRNSEAEFHREVILNSSRKSCKHFQTCPKRSTALMSSTHALQPSICFTNCGAILPQIKEAHARSYPRGGFWTYLHREEMQKRVKEMP